MLKFIAIVTVLRDVAFKKWLDDEGSALLNGLMPLCRSW
jgi:hypothetical protein